MHVDREAIAVNAALVGVGIWAVALVADELPRRLAITLSVLFRVVGVSLIVWALLRPAGRAGSDK